MSREETYDVESRKFLRIREVRMLSEIWIYKKNEKIFLVTLFLLLVVIGCLNWMLGLLTAIVIIGFVIVIEKMITSRNVFFSIILTSCRLA